MIFKVGDKINLINIDWSRMNGREGVVVEVRPPEREYHYEVYINASSKTPIKRGFYYPVRDNEIERVSVKGQQLLFEFMV